ncbi:Phosphorylase superfamily protein [Ruminococcaceae bacterium FB2012]|nr:Phosphorylase superfamily protein [Ruminococcaceae bacterium FB2012]
MLLEEFDKDKSAVIDPQMLIQKIDYFPEVTVACFSRQLFESVLEMFEPKLIVELHSAIAAKPVYEVVYKGRRFAFYQAFVGEPMAVGEYEELIAYGSKRLILFGNCGVLDSGIEDCGIIIPTAAIRDEGCSYHYAPPSDTIEVNKKYRELFCELLEECGIKYVTGTTWTTDAIYRETRSKVEKRRAQGAVCVEMECAGMQAVNDFRGTEFFQFLYAGDDLSGENWDPRSIFGDVKLNDKCRIALLAFEFGVRIIEENEADK